MFDSIYVLKIKDQKILKKLLKNHIYIEKIIYDKLGCFIYVDYDNYCKIIKYKKIFEISLIEVKGINKYKYLIKKYLLFFISVIISILSLYVLSNVIFDVSIMSNNKEIIKLLDNELEYYGISKYHFVKSYEEKEMIKTKILEDHKDKIEWLEIDRKGTKYTINVLERIINSEEDEETYRHLISKKNAIILEIKAENGSIIRKVNDYVNKGDIIVSGAITKGEDVVAYTRAKGIVYGETWYNVQVELPINYYSKLYTGKEKKRLVISFLNKKIKLFDFSKYKDEEYEDKVIFESNLLPFKFSYSKIKEVEIISDIYSYDKALEQGINLAREKLLTTLEKGSKILSQKKLKLYTKDSKIILEVFFKVYEDITDYCDILIEGD